MRPVGLMGWVTQSLTLSENLAIIPSTIDMATKAQKTELSAQPREILGNKVRHLRNSGLMPAVLYGKGMESMPLQVPVKDFEKILKTAGESTLIYLNVAGNAYPTIIHDVSRDPVKDNLMHADFYKVNLSEKIKTKVPVVFVGEAPAVKDLQGIFVRNINELEVEALPQDLPHEIKIDISRLANFGDQVLLKDIDLGAAVKVLGEDNEIIATVQQPISEEELKASLEAPTEAGEVEVIKREKEEEVPTEGEEGTAEVLAPAKETAKKE